MQMDSWYGGLAKEYLRVQLFWSPLVTAAAALALNPLQDFARVFPRSLLVAAVASSVCFVPVLFALGLSQRARARGRPPAAHGRAWYLALALAGMPLGLFLAAWVTQIVFGVRAPESFRDYRFGAFLGTLIAGLFFLWQSLGEARAAALAAELRLEQAETHKLKAQLSALTAQLNPHFLFNALNAIASLIQTDPEQAERTVLKLSELYRGILGATRREQHTLHDELELCQAYLDVERARFPDLFSVHVEVAETLDPKTVYVPVLVLQPAVENAVTHGLAERAPGGTLSLRAQRHGDTLELRVEDDGIGLGHSPRKGAGLGIETTRQRLRLCHGDSASLELASPLTGGTHVVVRLPLPGAP
jgi:two-component system, LytTR family, sensor kinase